MATTPAVGTADVLTHHLTAFSNNDLDAIMQDYTEESQVLTPQGPHQGLAAIRTFFADLFVLIPRGCEFELKQRTLVGAVAYLVWSSNSATATIPLGTDSLFFEEGKIRLQTVTLLVERK